jgi:hypothetical protein
VDGFASFLMQHRPGAPTAGMDNRMIAWKDGPGQPVFVNRTHAPKHHVLG